MVPSLEKATQRFRPSFDLEKSFSGKVVGLDEAGIGCWAGDVFAGISYVPFDTSPIILQELNDSKKLSLKKRETLFKSFDDYGIKWAVAAASLEEIDTLNIRGAALLAMERAFSMLDLSPDMALIDGTMKPTLPCPLKTVIKGDQKSYSIAAASIATKVVRDQHMAHLCKEYPHYGWDKNAGYGTRQHQDALEKHGVSPYHRKTYAPILKILQKEGLLLPPSNSK